MLDRLMRGKFLQKFLQITLLTARLPLRVLR
jgi:hypothetical protein